MPKIFVSFSVHGPGPRFARHLKTSLASRGIECVVDENALSTVGGQTRKGSSSLRGCSSMLALVTEDYARAVFDRESLVHKEVRS